MVSPAVERSDVRTSERAIDWNRVGLHALLLLGAVVMLYPLLWLASSSLKPAELIFSDPSLWPRRVDLSNYTRGWEGVALPFLAIGEPSPLGDGAEDELSGAVQLLDRRPHAVDPLLLWAVDRQDRVAVIAGEIHGIHVCRRGDVVAMRIG